MRKLILLFCFLSLQYVSCAQAQSITNFTIRDGLPSDWLHRSLVDSKGFLWIATEQGVARFDGRHFQHFTTAHGLPDIEVTNLLREGNDKIWIKGVNKKLAYYDAKKNIFINSRSDTQLNKVSGTTQVPIFKLQNGSIYFPKKDTSFVLKNSRYYSFPAIDQNIDDYVIRLNEDSSEIRIAISKTKDSNVYLYHTTKNRIISKELLGKYRSSLKCRLDENHLFLFDLKSKYVSIISDISTNPLRFTKTQLELSDTFYHHNFNKKHLAILYRNGHIDIYTRGNWKWVDSINCNTIPNGAFIDKENNTWVSTPSKGLFLFRKTKIKDFQLDARYQNTAWTSIVKKWGQALLIGNSSGEVLECYPNRDISKKRINGVKTDMMRHIILSQNKIFTFSEGGIHIGYSKEIKTKDKACKSAYALNDSIILCGFDGASYKINSITDQVSKLNTGGIYVKCFAKVDENKIYIGSPDGLYIFNLNRDTLEPIPNKDPRLKERIVSMLFTTDSILWIATASNGIWGLRNDKIIFHLTEKNGLQSNNSTAIALGRKHQVWLGTNRGISIINYNSGFPLIQNLSVNDGLSSNIINQMAFSNDTMYVATENGISVIPANISIPKFDIAVELTGLKIDNRDTILTNYYDLKANQNNIFIQFAGVELTGHFRNAQYSKNEGQSWTDHEGITLSLELNSGKHPIWFRAIDVNGNIGSKILKLQFDIATPLHQEPWFWSVIACIILAASMYLNTRLTKQKQQRKINELLNQQALDELEIQALKAQINPHFVFNCLNSIKGFLYEENFKMADLYLDKFSQLLRNTLDFSSQASISLESELNYIDTYLTLEKLRFGNKFEYSIECENQINKKEIAIPAMILQPYVENAIKHGVCNLTGNIGKILIKVYLVSDSLNIEIEDNGVGREKAFELKRRKQVNYNSKGTQLTERRIELYQIVLNIIDKQDDEGKALGTVIHLKIPLVI